MTPVQGRKQGRPGADAAAAISCTGLSMAYVPGVWTLQGIDLALAPGTVTAVAGENGAGKSTLYRILSGLQSPTRGRVLVNGSPLKVGAGQSRGVVYVPQELAPCPDLRVYENLFLGSEATLRGGLLRRSAMIKEAADVARTFEVDIDPTSRARSISTAGLQVLEIAKSIRKNPRVWILDEPTSSLGDAQVEHLFEQITRLKEHGTAVLYTTHRMNEITRLADRVIVLRDGHLALDESAENVNQDAIVHAMLGRQAREIYPELPRPGETTEPALEVRGLTVDGLLGEFDIQVRAGEIVGVAGLVGSGRSELLQGIFGSRAARGTVSVSGRPIRRGSVPAAIRAGMAYVPEDRKQEGLVAALSVRDNITLPWLYTFGKILSHSQARDRMASRVVETTALRCRSTRQLVSQLSGGNQQKALIGRALIGHVKVLLLDEPTRGVDVGARAEIYEALAQAAAGGLAILLVSSDRDEVVNLSHRILVMRGRRVVGTVSHDHADPRAELLRLSLGLDVEDPQIPRSDASTSTLTQDRNDLPQPP